MESISVHLAAETRDWSAAEIRALEQATERIRAERRAR
jgi:hypothetical protein